MATSPKYSDPEVLARIAGLTLRARQVVEGTISGLHRSPFHGFNVEFAEYREYSPGDDLRRLDWRVFGRTDRYYIKQYEEESNLRATIVVDCQRVDALRLRAADQVRLRRHGGRLAGHAAGRPARSGGAGAVRQPASASCCRRPPRRPSWCGSWAELEDAQPDRKTQLGPVLQSWPSRSATRADHHHLRSADRSRAVLRRALAAAVSRARDHGAARARQRRTGAAVRRPGLVPRHRRATKRCSPNRGRFATHTAKRCRSSSTKSAARAAAAASITCCCGPTRTWPRIEPLPARPRTSEQPSGHGQVRRQRDDEHSHLS